MDTRKEEIDKINELYNLGEISISEANDKRDAINKMSDDKFAKTSTLNKNTIFELSYEDKVLSPYYFPPEEDQMKQRDVASMFGRTVQTICSWTKSNRIPYFRIGEHPIYSRKQLILYASKNQHLISK